MQCEIPPPIKYDILHFLLSDQAFFFAADFVLLQKINHEYIRFPDAATTNLHIPDLLGICIYMPINVEKQRNIFTEFYFSVLIVSYIYCKIDM